MVSFQVDWRVSVSEPNLIIGPEYLGAVVKLVRGCESELAVVCYEWAWYSGQRGGTVQDVNRAVCQAAVRGVKVRVLLHNEPARRHLGGINRKTRGRLERHGVEVRMGHTGRALHAKFWLADGERASLHIHTKAKGFDRKHAERMLAWWLEQEHGITNPKFIWDRPEFVAQPYGFGDYS